MRLVLGIGIFAVIVALDVAWLTSALRTLKPVFPRFLAAVFGLAQLGGLTWLLLDRFSSISPAVTVKFVLSAIFLWHMIVLPLLLVSGLLVIPAITVKLFARKRSSEVTQTALNRRQFCQVALAVAPPLLNVTLAGIALRQLQHFRLRSFTIPIPALPRDLHGLTIAQVSDLHVGRFTSGRVLNDVVLATNKLHADLVLLSGDLINDALADLDAALDLVRQMEARSGIYLIKGIMI